MSVLLMPQNLKGLQIVLAQLELRAEAAVTFQSTAGSGPRPYWTSHCQLCTGHLLPPIRRHQINETNFL